MVGTRTGREIVARGGTFALAGTAAAANAASNASGRKRAPGTKTRRADVGTGGIGDSWVVMAGGRLRTPCPNGCVLRDRHRPNDRMPRPQSWCRGAPDIRPGAHADG